MNLDFSTCPVRTRMPGDVGGELAGQLTAPYPDFRRAGTSSCAVQGDVVLGDCFPARSTGNCN